MFMTLYALPYSVSAWGKSFNTLRSLTGGECPCLCLPVQVFVLDLVLVLVPSAIC